MPQEKLSLTQRQQLYREIMDELWKHNPQAADALWRRLHIGLELGDLESSSESG